MRARSPWEYFRSLFFITWFNFVIRYRKTMLGPLWILVGPIAFIVFIGTLYSSVGNLDLKVYFPHLTIGLIVWTLILGGTFGGGTLFLRQRSSILQGELDAGSILVIDTIRDVLHFLHQVVLIVGVMIFYKVDVNFYSLVAAPGLLVLLVNVMWMKMVFGTIGARFVDLPELLQPVMRIAFLSTPIIWMPTAGYGRNEIIGPYMMLNPFYHFVEIVRAPLMGNPILPVTWVFTIASAIVGSLVALILYKRCSSSLSSWL